jgi:hypothetical protein
MYRVLAMVAACLLIAAPVAWGDPMDNMVAQLERGRTYKVRLAAALALSKSKDARAVLALAAALTSDADATVPVEPP